MSDFHNELMKLIKTANKKCNLTNDSKENTKLITQKKIALTTLLALIASDTTTIKLLNQEELDSYINMIKNNIYRPIKYFNPKVLFYDELPDLSDPQWPHLELVYLILERIIHCLPKAVYFDYDFIRSLYPMLGSPDTNERKEIIHIFREFIFSHGEFNEKINHYLAQIFSMHCETQEKPFEVWTSLQIFLIICKLSLNQNKYDDLIEQTVLPLIKDTFSFYFDTHLTDLLSFYADGSPQNAKKVIEQILRYWPKTSIPKMNLYTKFLSQNISKLSQDDLKCMISPIFKLFSKECTSDSTTLAESSLSIISNPELEKVIDDNSNEIHKIMIPSIMNAVTEHWWPGIRDKGTVSIASVISKSSMDYVKDIAVSSVQNKKDDDQNSYNDWIKVMNFASTNYIDISSSDEKSKIDKEFENCANNDGEKDNDYDESAKYPIDKEEDHSKDNNYNDKSYSKPLSSSINYNDYNRTNNYQDDDIYFYDTLDY